MSSAATRNSEILKIISTFEVSRICTCLKNRASKDPAASPRMIPRRIETGIFIKLTAETPFPCIMPVNVENRTIT